MQFSAVYLPTTLFSLKDSNSTNSGAKTLFLPSPYAIKMAILNQAITVGGDLKKLESKKSREFSYIRDANISFHIPQSSNFCVNNTFVKILKPARSGGGFQQTVAFREYVFLSHSLEMIFKVANGEAKNYWQKYLYKINYFGKKGCFFQFLKYSDFPNDANVKSFEAKSDFGILQEYDDFGAGVTFEQVSNYSTKKAKRSKQIWVLPLQNVNSSKSFTSYKMISNG